MVPVGTHAQGWILKSSVDMAWRLEQKDLGKNDWLQALALPSICPSEVCISRPYAFHHQECQPRTLVLGSELLEQAEEEQGAQSA